MESNNRILLSKLEISAQQTRDIIKKLAVFERKPAGHIWFFWCRDLVKKMMGKILEETGCKDYNLGL